MNEEHHNESRFYHEIKDPEPFKPRDLMLYNKLPLYEIGHFISKEEAKEHICNFREDPHWYFNVSEKQPVESFLIGKGMLLKLLGQPECHGLRIYFAKKEYDHLKNEKLIPTLIFTGVYSDGKDMIEHTLIGNGGYPCPDVCDDDMGGD